MDMDSNLKYDPQIPDCYWNRETPRQERTAVGLSQTFICDDRRTESPAIVYAYDPASDDEATNVLALQKKLCEVLADNQFRFRVAYDGGKSSTGYWIAFRHQSIEPLVEWWEQSQSPNNRISVLLEIAVAISVLHKANVVHGRLCPECIYVETSGPDIRCVIGDTLSVQNQWGFNVSSSSNYSYLRYSIPDTSLVGKPTVVDDTYALGMIIVNLLTLNSNLKASDQQIISEYSKKLLDIPSQNQSLLKDFVKLLLQLLGSKPIHPKTLTYSNYWAIQPETSKSGQVWTESQTTKANSRYTNTQDLTTEYPEKSKNPVLIFLGCITLLCICFIPFMCKSPPKPSNTESGKNISGPTKESTGNATNKTGKSTPSSPPKPSGETNKTKGRQPQNNGNKDRGTAGMAEEAVKDAAMPNISPIMDEGSSQDKAGVVYDLQR